MREGQLASTFVGSVGVVLIAAAVVGYFTDRPSETTIALTAIGAALVAISALLKRLTGTVKIGPTGAEITVSEYQIAKGEVLDANVAVEAALSDEGAADANADDKAASKTLEPAKSTRGGDTTAVITGPPLPPVLLTRAANDVMQQLSEKERRAVTSALKDLGKTDNDKRLASTRAGVMYMVRRVGANVRLIYRLLDKTAEDIPDQYVIVAIETGAHSWREQPDDIQFWP